jgi:hypothetical protein
MAKIKYGLEWDDAYDDYMIELKMYQFPGWHPPGHRVKPYEHFIRAAQMIWGKNNPSQKFIWHPWAVDMTIQACENKELGLAGPSSCGKSEWSAVWILLNLYADPQHTLGYATSTTLQTAKKKIWGSVVRYFEATPTHIRAHLTLVENPSPEIYVERGGRKVPQCGVSLVACASAQGREAINKLQGSKANADSDALSVLEPGHGRILMMADELSDLSQAILSAMDNLKNGGMWHSFVAASNPRNHLDPFSRFVEPADGWESIDVNTSIWRTKRGGVCLHFDDLKSPNYLQYLEYHNEVNQGLHRDDNNNIIPYRKKWPIKGGDTIYEETQTSDILSPLYWRNSRGYWSPVGSENTIYTAEDIKASGADKLFDDWLNTRPKIRCMGVDLAHSSGGDFTVAVIGDMGWCAKRRCLVVEIVAVEEINTDASNKKQTHTHQMGEKIKTLAQKYRVAIPDIGVDSTNPSAADGVVAALGSNDIVRVSFGGNATDVPVSDLDPTPAKDKYGNRMTELWFFGKELLRHRQLYGITDDIAMELVARYYETSKAGGIIKLVAEPKPEMKKRTGGASPDHADAMCILLDVFRQRHGLRTTETKLENQVNGSKAAWLDFCNKQSSARSGRRITLRSAKR